MKEIQLPPELSKKLTNLYAAMEAGYDQVAGEISLTCAGCRDNCCDSYFQHHTYSEWAYLWEGIRTLDAGLMNRIRDRAQQYVAESRALLAGGERPQLMCPLNEDGLCALYSHRLMICRMHGIPATMTRPDGRQLRFPGCFHCQEIVEKKYEQETDAPGMDRTELFRKLAGLENELLGGKRHLFPRVRRTIADMIMTGPPRVAEPFCAR